MNRILSPSLLALIGTLAVAITLGVILGGLLVGEARLLALGMALGLILGAPMGIAAYTLGHRRGEANARATLIALTPEQAEGLARVLERQQASPAAFGLATRQPREIVTVGGADLSAVSGDPDDPQP